MEVQRGQNFDTIVFAVIVVVVAVVVVVVVAAVAVIVVDGCILASPNRYQILFGIFLIPEVKLQLPM